MLQLHSVKDGLPIFKALSSEVRVAIYELLCHQGPMRMSDICENVGITNGALTSHMRLLMESGLVSVQVVPGKHGNQKLCTALKDKIVIDQAGTQSNLSVYETEISVGTYTAYEVYPTCGLATAEHVIGIEDDPRFFASPERIHAGILWMGRGYVEYIIPNYLEKGQQLLEIQISFEIASEAPGSSEDWPSDISFALNGRDLGTWTSPSDFGLIQGIYTPKWWNRIWNQHGLYKVLSINKTGSYLDGGRISNTSLEDLRIDHRSSLTLRFEVKADAKNCGGLTLYGSGFGNYNQDIRVRMHYKAAEEPARDR